MSTPGLPMNRVTDDLRIVSTIEATGKLNEPSKLLRCQGIPKGSIYQQLIINIRHLLETDQDFAWFINHTDERRSIRSLRDIEKRSKRYGYVLSQAGVKKDDIVCMMLGPGNTDVMLAAFGTWILGGVVFFGDFRVGTQTFSKQLSDLNCKYIICTEPMQDFCNIAIQTVDLNTKVVVIVEDVENVEYKMIEKDDKITEIEADENAAEKCPDPLNLDCDNDLAVITYTSGTSGFPKAMMQTHTSVWNFFNSGLEFHLGSKSVGVSSMKCDTFIGISFYFTNLVQHQITIVLIGDDDFEKNVFSAIEEYKPTNITVYGNHFVRLAESDFLEEYSKKGLLDTVLSILPAGSSVPLESEDRLKRFFPNLKHGSYLYGCTEVALVSFSDSCTHLGTLIQNVEAKIVSLDDPLKRLGPGESGEICIRKPHMMKGYYNCPEQTKLFFDEEGFAHIGDLGRYDENGRIYYMERIKEVIKYNDFRVWPTIVEAELQKHPAVLECLVYGKPNPPTMELVAAMIVLKDGYTEIGEEDINEFLKSRMEDPNLIRGGICFSKKLPRNTMGKLLRREARAMALNEK